MMMPGGSSPFTVMLQAVFFVGCAVLRGIDGAAAEASPFSLVELTA